MDAACCALLLLLQGRARSSGDCSEQRLAAWMVVVKAQEGQTARSLSTTYNQKSELELATFLSVR
jgi:hypothetical protein